MVKNPPANAGESDVGSIPGLGRSPGGGYDNPLQYSCLENPMDRGDWQAVSGSQRVRHNRHNRSNLARTFWLECPGIHYHPNSGFIWLFLQYYSCLCYLPRILTKIKKIKIKKKKKKNTLFKHKHFLSMLNPCLFKREYSHLI